jgi:hypothetical protein
VYPYPAGPRHSYLVPSLDVEITVDGPLAQRVLHTLTWSPRSSCSPQVAHRQSRRRGVL